MGIQDEVRNLVNTESAKHKRLIAYVVSQLEADRDLAAILDDPYVTNRLAAVDRLALLEEPEVVAAAGDEVLARLRANLESLAGG
jgi:DNA-binding transcriptional regulator YbjK